RGRLKGRQTRYILEAIKAKEALPLIKQYLDAGKKVVVFHDFNKNEAKNPFVLDKDDFVIKDDVDGQIARQALAEYKVFRKEHPELLNLDLSNLASPIEAIKIFGDRARIFNGKVSKKDRAKAVKDFNNDDSGADVILCQRDAGKEGISLHDTTGKHQRVLIDLGLATKPTDTIQTEGRIRRTGAVSNAIIRYLNTGTNVERFAFATTIAGRASTAENLAMGEDARNLKQSIIDSFEESQNDDWQKYLPGSETEGTGGQARDASDASKISLYEKAKTFYFGRGKRTSKNKAREGTDYFATPEPIGLKMVEWLKLENGESVLEPSAGHGAISRWFSETTKNTIIEPSGELSTQARMTLNGGTTSRVVSGTFENFDLVNKFDGIAMNPPFGTGGKTAVDHITKAFKHLRAGGRMVAILPEGPSADKHFTKWYYGEEKDGEQVGGVENAHLVANIHLPSVTFERAGTKVATRIVVIDKIPKNYEGYLSSTEELDLRDITDINELFDELENMEMPRRKKTSERQEASDNNSAPVTSSLLTAGTYKHTKKGILIPNAELPARVERKVYENLNKIAQQNGGYFSRYAKSFLFEKGGEEGRDAFLREAGKILSETSSESPIENEGDLGENKKDRRYSLSMSDEGLTKTNDDWRTNKIHIGDRGSRTIELLYRPFMNEEAEERYRRRMMEVSRIDSKYDKGVSKNPYVNFVGQSGRKDIEARFEAGQSLEEIVDDLNDTFKNIIYNEGIQNEGKVIEKLMVLRGGMEYAREYVARDDNAGRNSRTSVRAVQRGQLEHSASSEQNGRRISRDSHQNSIRPTSRTEKGGFSYARRSVDELKAEVKEAFPNATKTEETKGGVILTMPNGMKMTVSVKGKITVSGNELARAKEAHGMESDIEVTVEGYEETVDGGAFIALSQGSRKGTGFHEAYHVAEDLVFTEKEKKDAKRLISDNDEKRADAFTEWKVSRGKKQSSFAKLWRKISDFAARMASLAGIETKRGLFLKVESGEMYNRNNMGTFDANNPDIRYSVRGSGNNRKYSLSAEELPAPNSNKTLWSKIKNIFTTDNSEKARYRQRMAKALESALGVKIRYGKMGLPHGASAVVFKEKDKVIRSQNAYDWENILPVASGIIADKIGIANATEEQKNVISNWFLEGTLDSESEAGKAFVKALNEDTNAAIKTRLIDAQNLFKQWLNKEADEKMKDAIVDEPLKKNKSLTEWKDYVYNEMVEELAPVERLVAEYEKTAGKKLNISINPAVALRLLRGQGERVLTMVNGDTTLAVEALKMRYPAVDWTGFKTLKDIIGSIDAYQDKAKQKDFMEYCVACQMLEMHEANEGIDAEKETLRDDIETLQRQIEGTQNEQYKASLRSELDEVEGELAKLEERKRYIVHSAYPKELCEKIIEKGSEKYGQAQKDLVRYSNILSNILYDSGVISGKQYKAMMSKWQNYIPLHREFEENEDIDFGDSLMERLGSERNIINPLASIIHNTGEYIRRAERNKAIKTLADFSRVDGTGWLVEEITDNNPDTRTTVSYHENGKKKYLELNDPTIAKAINRMDADNSDLMVQIMHAVTKVSRACFTIINPEFIARNPIRDAQDAYLYDGVSPMQIIKGFLHAFKKDATYYEWATSGAAQSALVTLDRDYTQEAIDSMGKDWKSRLFSKNFIPTLIQGLQKASELSEYGTRIWQTLRRKNRSRRQRSLSRRSRSGTSTPARSSRCIMRDGQPRRSP
ncbi:MAG: methyltransferase, partial [Selenomonadaceae bacterium]|nr:methyltransferase [Selenomonadaceae bacterium]